MARPQAIINDGASLLKDCGFTFEASDISANGLAMTVGVSSCDSTSSSIPGIEAQPPASAIKSTELYCPEV